MNPKIFCIGFHKTGTTSLAEALRKLGYRVTGPNGVHNPHISENVLAVAARAVERFDAFQDNPWPVIYRALDQRYPGSKFILTLREPKSWIRSQVQHFGRRDTEMRKWIYGVGHPEGNEELYLKRYATHNREVFEYFKDRPDDLLVMDLAKGDGWEKLCPFLGKPVPTEPFPHANKAADRQARSAQRRATSQGLRGSGPAARQRRAAAARAKAAAEPTLAQRLKRLVGPLLPR